MVLICLSPFKYRSKYIYPCLIECLNINDNHSLKVWLKAWILAFASAVRVMHELPSITLWNCYCYTVLQSLPLFAISAPESFPAWSVSDEMRCHCPPAICQSSPYTSLPSSEKTNKTKIENNTYMYTYPGTCGT